MFTTIIVLSLLAYAVGSYAILIDTRAGKENMVAINKGIK